VLSRVVAVRALTEEAPLVLSEAHLCNSYGKLGLASRAAAVRFAIDHGLA
jgi:hypothetical protein